jgi:MSHA biogenesis protein MshJ
MIKKALQPYIDKISKLSVRERLMVFFAVATVAVFTAETVLLSPLEKQRHSVSQQVESQKAEIADLETQLVDLRAARQKDPEMLAQARLRDIHSRLRVIDGTLQGVQKQLVSPERIPGLLAEMLRPHRSLQLVSLRTLPVIGLIPGQSANGEAAGTDPAAPGDAGSGQTSGASGADGAAASGQDPSAGAPAAQPGSDGQTASADPAVSSGQVKRPLAEGNIYKHGVEITLRGGYLDMLDYLTQLERFPLRMYWGQMQLDASNPAYATMVLTVYTLSLDKAWLRISDS